MNMDHWKNLYLLLPAKIRKLAIKVLLYFLEKELKRGFLAPKTKLPPGKSALCVNFRPPGVESFGACVKNGPFAEISEKNKSANERKVYTEKMIPGPPGSTRILTEPNRIQYSKHTSLSQIMAWERMAVHLEKIRQTTHTEEIRIRRDKIVNCIHEVLKKELPDHTV